MSDFSSYSSPADVLMTAVEARLARLRQTNDEITESAPSILWQPDPDNHPQLNAYHSRADVVGYGGAAGGGKTDLALGAALTRHHRSLILRRVGTEHEANLKRLVDIIGHENGLNRTSRTWRDLPGGRSIELGSTPRPNDWRKYAGQAFDLIVFDEAPQFLETQVRTLQTWNRTTSPGQLAQSLLAFNPPTRAEEEWIIDYFGPWLDEDHPNPAQPGELRYFADLGDGEIEVGGRTVRDHQGNQLRARSRTFFPARVEDNKYLMRTDYAATLDGLPADLRERLRYGLITRNITDQPLQLIPRDWVIAAQKRWIEHHASASAENTDPIDHLGLPLTQTGADISRGGKDATVIANRYGPYFAPLERHQGDVTNDGPKAAALILAANDGRARIAIDAIGVGTSALDSLRANHPNVLAIVGSEASGSVDRDGRRQPATDKTGRYRLRNRRTELWWRLMEALDPEHGEGLMLPPDAILRRQLTTPRYKLIPGGVALESKDDIKARSGGKSPDEAEAIVYAHAEPLERPPAATATHVRAALTAAKLVSARRQEERSPSGPTALYRPGRRGK